MAKRKGKSHGKKIERFRTRHPEGRKAFAHAKRIKRRDTRVAALKRWRLKHPKTKKQ